MMTVTRRIFLLNGSIYVEQFFFFAYVTKRSPLCVNTYTLLFRNSKSSKMFISSAVSVQINRKALYYIEKKNQFCVSHSKLS